MPSPQIEVAAASTRTESEVRGTKALALKVVEAQKAYKALLLCDTSGMSDDDLAEREIKMARARREMGAASFALSQAMDA